MGISCRALSCRLRKPTVKKNHNSVPLSSKVLLVVRGDCVAKAPSWRKVAPLKSYWFPWFQSWWWFQTPTTSATGTGFCVNKVRFYYETGWVLGFFVIEIATVIIGEWCHVAHPDLCMSWGSRPFPVSFCPFSCVVPLSSPVLLVRKGQARGRGPAGWRTLGNRPNVLCNNFTHSLRHIRTQLSNVQQPFSVSHRHTYTCLNVISFGWVIRQRLSFCLTYFPALQLSSPASQGICSFKRGRTRTRMCVSVRLMFEGTWGFVNTITLYSQWIIKSAMALPQSDDSSLRMCMFVHALKVPSL